MKEQADVERRSGTYVLVSGICPFARLWFWAIVEHPLKSSLAKTRTKAQIRSDQAFALCKVMQAACYQQVMPVGFLLLVTRRFGHLDLSNGCCAQPCCRRGSTLRFEVNGR